MFSAGNTSKLFTIEEMEAMREEHERRKIQRANLIKHMKRASKLTQKCAFPVKTQNDNPLESS